MIWVVLFGSARDGFPLKDIYNEPTGNRHNQGGQEMTAIEFINGHMVVTGRDGKTSTVKMTEAQKNLIRVSRQPCFSPAKIYFARRRLKNEMIDNIKLSQ